MFTLNVLRDNTTFLLSRYFIRRYFKLIKFFCVSGQRTCTAWIPEFLLFLTKLSADCFQRQLSEQPTQQCLGRFPLYTYPIEATFHVTYR